MEVEMPIRNEINIVKMPKMILYKLYFRLKKEEVINPIMPIAVPQSTKAWLKLTIRNRSNPNRNPIKILAKGNCKIFT